MKFATFKKGVHPDDAKHYTAAKAISSMPLPDDVFIPLQQHIGAPCEPLVAVGDEVKTGQIIATNDKFVSSPVHASVTGKVKAIGPFQHPLGARVQMIHIQRSGDDDWELMPKYGAWEELTDTDLRKLVQEAGIVGLGGAAFPTHVKLAPPPEKPVDSFILNGCECEPFLTADHRVMLEMADDVVTGMQIIMQILGVSKAYIGIENNKPDAIARLKSCIAHRTAAIEVLTLETKYPQGAEKMLIEAVLHRRVPVGGLPLDVGVVVNNIGTALAVSEAVLEGKPLIQRVVTVTGDGVQDAKNVMARIGTPFSRVLEFCGGLKEEAVQVFMGGPMMGFSLFTLDVPVVKATSGIICSTENSLSADDVYPCIRCGSCVSACPVNLLPTRLARYAELGNWDAAADWGISNCMECGSCAFVCPSNIPLVQWLRVGKLKASQLLKKRAA